MKEKDCPKCNGKGVTYGTYYTTVGITAFSYNRFKRMGPYTCSLCKGTGKVPADKDSQQHKRQWR